MQFTNDFSRDVWEITYKYKEEKDINESFERVATAIASVEDRKDYWKDRFYYILNNEYFCPGGRILANAGTSYDTTLFNCFTSTIPKYDADSIEGIVETLLVQMLTLKSEGGWADNFSRLRPRGSFINGIGVESPGAIKYMELYNRSSDIITSGSGKEDKERYKAKIKKGRIRKGAQLAALFNNHPDIEEFITAKRTPNRLDKFNVSVACYDDFMEKVLLLEETGEDSNLDLVFPETTFEKYKSEWDGDINLWIEKGYPINVYKSISVKYLWELIMRSTYENNDPGVIFIDRANKTYLANYLNKRIMGSNACGEQTMPPGSICDLGSIVLTKFIIPNSYDKPWYQRIKLTILQEVVECAVRFLDNINDYSKTPWNEYTINAREMRRIGLGIMGWGSFLYLLGIRFGSDLAEEVKNKIMKLIAFTAIETSIQLAKEKGCFVGCDKDKLADHYYFKQIGLPDAIMEEIRQYGLRNSALFSIQPTGNTSVLQNIVSGGCEPLFMHEYIRTVIVQTPPDHIKDQCPAYWAGELRETDLFKWTREGKEDILRGIDEMGTVWKIDRNRGLTKEVLCEDYAVWQLKLDGQWNPEANWAVTTDNLTVEDHIKDLKGWAKWIDAAISKTVNIPSSYSYEDFKKLYLNAYKSGVIKGITTYRVGTMCNVLSSVEKKENIQKTNAPIRPKRLPAQVFHAQVKGEKFIVIVGLMDNSPYEVFAWPSINFNVPTSIISGFVDRVKSGHYKLIVDDHVVIDNISIHSDPNQETVNRLVSTSLRHGTDVKFLVSQLNKTTGDMYSLSKVLARILKRYIAEGEKICESCPQCNEKLVKESGCFICKNCSWSKC